MHYIKSYTLKCWSSYTLKKNYNTDDIYSFLFYTQNFYSEHAFFCYQETKEINYFEGGRII